MKLIDPMPNVSKAVIFVLNSLAPSCFLGFSGKKTPKRTWLCAGISLVQYALQTR